MTLTLNFEDGSVDAANLEKVKELFELESETDAIFDALRLIATRGDVFYQSKKVLHTLKRYFEAEEWLKEQILTL